MSFRKLIIQYIRENIEEMSTCVVKPGQGPWQVAEEHLGDGSRWREIMRLNGLKDDHILHPGDVLQLPPRHSMISDLFTLILQLIFNNHS